jgi:predicted nucleic acid-binding protein
MLDGTRGLCIDASVGAKWFLRDEVGSQKALELLERLVAGDLLMYVPELFVYEIGNLMSLAVRRGRVTAETAEAALEELKRLNLEVVAAASELRSAMSFSLRFGLSLYDATYLAVAESRGVPLVTSDRRLLGLTSPSLIWVLDLGNLSSQPK